MGKGVEKAVANVNDVLAGALVGHDARAQQEIDMLMTVPRAAGVSLPPAHLCHGAGLKICCVKR